MELGARPVVTELPGVRDILYILYMYPKNREERNLIKIEAGSNNAMPVTTRSAAARSVESAAGDALRLV